MCTRCATSVTVNDDFDSYCLLMSCTERVLDAVVFATALHVELTLVGFHSGSYILMTNAPFIFLLACTPIPKTQHSPTYPHTSGVGFIIPDTSDKKPLALLTVRFEFFFRVKRKAGVYSSVLQA